MKGNLDNYSVVDIKELFFDMRIVQDIKYIENNFLSKKINQNNRKYFEQIVVYCKAMLKVNLVDESSKVELEKLFRDYILLIEPVKKKDDDNSVLRTNVSLIAQILGKLQKLAS